MVQTDYFRFVRWEGYY